MEELNKQQLILLGILIAFVTSIATGITTVSLMQQEPGGVTQTINRVVERTVEKVVQAPSQQASVVSTKETVIVKADDVIVDAIAKTVPSLPVIYEASADEGATSTVFRSITRGVLMPDSTIAVDSEKIKKSGNYFIANGEKMEALVFIDDRSTIGFEYMALKATTTSPKDLSLVPSTFNQKSELKLGQAVIAIGGGESISVSEGIISAFGKIDFNDISDGVLGLATTTTESLALTIVIDSTAVLKEPKKGGVLVNLSGEVVGIYSGYFGNRFVSVSLLINAPRAMPLGEKKP